MAVEMVKSVYRGRGRDGDFGWMITQDHHRRSLFVFNDNETQFRRHHDLLGTQHTCSAGGGNAVIRPFQCCTPPRAIGIPTGHSGGYPSLDDHARHIIDASLAHLAGLIRSGEYDTVIVSWDEAAGTLGTGIFTVGRDVCDYIIEGITRATTGPVS